MGGTLVDGATLSTGVQSCEVPAATSPAWWYNQFNPLE